MRFWFHLQLPLYAHLSCMVHAITITCQSVAHFLSVAPIVKESAIFHCLRNPRHTDISEPKGLPPKKEAVILQFVTLSIVDQCSKFFYWQIPKEIIDAFMMETSTAPEVRCCTISWNLKIHNFSKTLHFFVYSSFLPQILLSCNKNFGKCGSVNRLLKQLANSLVTYRLYVRSKLLWQTCSYINNNACNLNLQNVAGHGAYVTKNRQTRCG